MQRPLFQRRNISLSNCLAWCAGIESGSMPCFCNMARCFSDRIIWLSQPRALWGVICNMLNGSTDCIEYWALATSRALRAASSCRRFCISATILAWASSSSSDIRTAFPLFLATSNAFSIASSETFPPRMSAVVINLWRPLFPTKSIILQELLADVAMADFRSSADAASSPSMTPGSGRMARPAIWA